MALIAAAAAVAGAGISAAGAVEQGQATSKAAAFQAQVASNNAITAGQNADYAIAAGNAKAEAVSLKGAETGGRIKAAQAANNIAVGTGSAVNVQTSQREQEQLDTETVANNAQLQAYGYRTQQTGFTAQGALDTAVSKQAPIGADIGAAGSLLSNAASVGFKFGAPGTTTPTPTSGPDLGGGIWPT